MELLMIVLAVLGAGNTVMLLVVLAMNLRGRGTGDGAQHAVREELRAGTADLRQELQAQRQEIRQVLAESQQQVEQRLLTTSEAQVRELVRERDARSSHSRDLTELLTRSLAELNDSMHAARASSTDAHSAFKTSVESRFEKLQEANEAKLEKVRETVGEGLQGTLKVALDENAQRIQRLSDTNVEKHGELQKILRDEMDILRKGNEAKLEKMRETVDEKLQGTLEKRLGESFALVSERLEQVQKGLGEMQTLASDVGGLKRVLTNVKNRGSWGEVQLERQLEDVLTPDQYERNVVIRPDSRDSVEFAVKLPGNADQDRAVYLPIDSKFPQEDYERLLEAQESGEKEAIDAAGKSIERVVLTQAKLIADKYIEPPYSTDFAIMYLPTEGLFAEIVRKPGLASRLQNDHKILITGPTTLMSLLNSLQMGFRTLAIEKRTSEVWDVLSAAKQEFKKYGDVWEKLGRQLQTAQNTVKEAGQRTRAVERKLRGVETLETIETNELLDGVFSEVDGEAEISVP